MQLSKSKRFFFHLTITVKKNKFKVNKATTMKKLKTSNFMQNQ